MSVGGSNGVPPSWTAWAKLLSTSSTYISSTTLVPPSVSGERGPFGSNPGMSVSWRYDSPILNCTKMPGMPGIFVQFKIKLERGAAVAHHEIRNYLPIVWSSSEDGHVMCPFAD